MKKSGQFLELIGISFISGLLVYGAWSWLSSLDWSGGMDLGPNIFTFIPFLFILYILPIVGALPSIWLVTNHFGHKFHIIFCSILLIFINSFGLLIERSVLFLLLYPVVFVGHALVFDYLIPPIPHVRYGLRAFGTWAVILLILVLLETILGN